MTHTHMYARMHTYIDMCPQISGSEVTLITLPAGHTPSMWPARMAFTQVVNKAGTPVSPTAKVVISGEELKYVCRAGFKLERALDHFEIDPTGLVCLDSGLSTGGFTDCLLQRGAAHVSVNTVRMHACVFMCVWTHSNTHIDRQSTCVFHAQLKGAYKVQTQQHGWSHVSVRLC